MSWRRIATTPAGTVTVQRWWSAAQLEVKNQKAAATNPQKGLIHTAVLLEKFLEKTQPVTVSGASATTLTPPLTSVADLSASDWSHLFSAAVFNPSCSNRDDCFTFVASDWHLFASAQAARNATTPRESVSGSDQPAPSSAPPCPILNIVARRAADFAYNNHVYEAMRRSSDWNEIVSAVCNRVTDTGTHGPSMVKTASDFDEHRDSHKNCSLLGSDAAAATAALARCVNENMEAANLLSKCVDSDEIARIPCAINFFPHRVPVSSVCYQNGSFFTIVNLKPVEVAGHLLVIPKNCTSNLFDALSAKSSSSTTNSGGALQSETLLADLGDAIVKTIAALNKRRQLTSATHKPCCGMSVVVQQNKHAGQTVSHLHVHVIALVRGQGLLAGMSSVDPDADSRSADELEKEEAELRRPRTAEAMDREAKELRENFF